MEVILNSNCFLKLINYYFIVLFISFFEFKSPMWRGSYGEVVVIFSHSNLPCGVVAMKECALMLGFGCNHCCMGMIT